MSLIIAENIHQQFGAQEVLKGISCRVAEGDRVAVVGPNGEGKTTLVRILAGDLEPTTGSVHRRRGLRVGYLPQDPPSLPDITVHAAMLDEFADARRMEDELHALSARLAAEPSNAKLLAQYGELEAHFEASGGYAYPVRIEQVLTGLGFERETWDRPLAALSGGQRTRVHLARLLAREPDVLLLDEPTNHLDIDSVEWLERWLVSFSGAVVVVSHDRWFLDRVTTATWEVAFGAMESYPAPYTRYLAIRDQRHLELRRRFEAQEEYIEKTREFIRLHIAGQRTKEARGRRKRLERYLRDEALDRPRESGTISLSLGKTSRSGNVVLMARDLVCGYTPDRPIVSAERLLLERGQRVAVVGANGSGKTTLLRTLLGELEPLAGEVRIGASVETGTLSQTHAELEADQTAIQAVMSAEQGLTEELARTLLGNMLLSGDDAFKTVAQLSGGQRSRVILARLVVQSANVLMLDEPTNHLDLPSTEIMQDVLRRFDGTVLFITHDRRLIDAVATDVWVIEDGGVHRVAGAWESYARWRDSRRAAGNDGVSDARDVRRAEHAEQRRKTNEMQRLRRRHEEIEAEIASLESRLAAIDAELTQASTAGDLKRIESLGREHVDRNARLTALWTEWEDVGGKLE